MNGEKGLAWSLDWVSWLSSAKYCLGLENGKYNKCKNTATVQNCPGITIFKSWSDQRVGNRVSLGVDYDVVSVQMMVMGL